MEDKYWYTTDQGSQLEQAEFKKNYPPFVPFSLSENAKYKFGEYYRSLLQMQNGRDTDDYYMGESHKIHRYLNGIKENSKLLLLGTGTGREVLTAKHVYNIDAYGTTLGSRNIYFGTKILKIPEDRLIECVSEDMPFNNEYFDAVHGYQVFEHAISPLIFLLEIGRVLVPGGKLLLEWPPGKDYSMGSNPHHQICYSPGQAGALLEKAGFVNISLLKDTLEPIPKEDIWRNDQNYMLVVTANKGHSNEQYIRNAWTW